MQVSPSVSLGEFQNIYIVMHPFTGCRGKCIMFTLGGAPQKILNSSLAIGQAAVTVHRREGPLLAWTDPLSIGKGLAWQRNQLVFFFFKLCLKCIVIYCNGNILF